MPKPGYKSITVSERVYKTFFKVYEENKKGLEIKGIRSFSGYLTRELQCLLDERADCVHVGFVYSLPELYNNEKVKAPPPRAAYTPTES
jgi:hypothetical protein